MRIHELLSKIESINQRLKSLILYNWRFGICGKRVVIGNYPRLINPHLLKIGNRVSIGPMARLEVHLQQSEGASISIGDNTRIEHAVHIYAAGHLEIGRFVMIASGCLITDNNHGDNPDLGPYALQKLNYKTTKIGNNVWLGENVAVLSGAVIGDNAIIGSNSVVNRAIPANCIAIGSPAKPIKMFDATTKKWLRVNDVQK